jgi:hypothetical protein
MPTFGALGQASAVCARCTVCGHKDATIQHPGWGVPDIGFLPFPQLVPPKALEPIGRERRVPGRILDIAMPQVSLERPGNRPRH